MNAMMDTDIIARVERINGKLYEAGTEFRVIYDRVWKSGGERDALILKTDGKSISPIAYPDNSWWKMSDAEIAEVLEDMYLKSKHLDIGDIEGYMSPQHIQASVLPRLVSGNNLSVLIQNGITCIPFLNMATVFYVPLPNFVSDGDASYRITDAMLQDMDIKKEELCKWASDNLKAQDPVFQPLVSVLEDMCGQEMGCGNGLWVLTNDEKLFGATMLLRDDVLKKVGKCFQGDAVILPSSVHEILALPYEETMDLLYLTEMVQAINTECVQQEDVLSDNIYIYHQKDGYLTAVL